MRKRMLGTNGVTVSELGFGCMGMSEFYGHGDDAESLKVLDRALELGVTFYDTADMYGIGHNEELVGKFIAGRRDKLVIATKFGIVRDAADPSLRTVDNSPAYIRNACEASLRRLRIDTIDLYYIHRKDPNVPIEDSVSTLADLVRAGKIRHIGLSEVSAPTLRRAHAVHPVAALQSEYSLWTRDPEPDVLPTCRELGIGVVAYSPLGRGFLTGRLNSPDDLEQDDFRRRNPRFAEENFRRNMALVSVVEAIAEAHGASSGQIALAWLLSRGPDIVPIPGTKRRKYVEENVGAAGVNLTEDDLRQLDEALPLGAAAGDRYPEEGMRSIQG